MNIELVRATPDDVGDYIRIAKQVISRFNCVAIDIMDVIKEIDESVVYMIKVDEEKVGFISYFYWSAKLVYISEVQVEPAYQGKGIGGFALDYVLKKLPQVETFNLHTHPESKAQKLYTRHGFKATGEVSENHRNTGEPRIHMVLQGKRLQQQ